MTNAREQILNDVFAKFGALELAVQIITINLVKQGSLDAKTFVGHLRQEYEKLPTLDQHNNEVLAGSQIARDKVIADLIQYSQLADDWRSQSGFGRPE